MILRSLATSIRKQDWFAVVIETSIVVLGVFLGIQLGNWNEARHLNVQKAAAIDRLQDEVEEVVAFVASYTENFEQRNQERVLALRCLHGGSCDELDSVTFEFALRSITVAPSVTPTRTVYDELISTGLFAELGDAQMRAAVASYYSQINYMAGQTDYVREFLLRRPELTSFEGASSVFDEAAPRQRRIVFDTETLARNPDFLEHVLFGHQSQLALTEWWSGTLESAQRMCAEVARVSGRPCEPSFAGEVESP
ncbi:hypothetical protein [Ponticaulis sp.]|uniref:hypothetical protein n=1 Tax=Ponticaulis sp. TaxID=2020902 RepID=UPI000B741F1E|nr:hypothetical protein [Ponticaulis sp.]MAI90359.1 hypothetical protein [Ponticaulis sp.]OUX99995.1 MAG: hypothetical protein CBB65_07960 [Hyphomonadaceae bacterium TMED5]